MEGKKSAKIIACCGFTLIEVLVAAFLASLLTAIFIQLFHTVEVSNSLQEKMLSMEQRGRFAIAFLRRRVQEAGRADCVAGLTVNHQKALMGDHVSGSDRLIIGSCIRYHGKKQFIQMRYFVAKTGRRDKRGNATFALFQKPVGGNREEIVENISGMVVRYGSHNVVSAQVDQWENVKNVLIALTVASKNQRLSSKRWYTFVGLRERMG